MRQADDLSIIHCCSVIVLAKRSVQITHNGEHIAPRIRECLVLKMTKRVCCVLSCVLSVFLPNGRTSTRTPTKRTSLVRFVGTRSTTGPHTMKLPHLCDWRRCRGCVTRFTRHTDQIESFNDVDISDSNGLLGLDNVYLYGGGSI